LIRQRLLERAAHRLLEVTMADKQPNQAMPEHKAGGSAGAKEPGTGRGPGGESGGGAYPNPHTGKGGTGEFHGGQSGSGYHGSQQLGDKKLDPDGGGNPNAGSQSSE